MEYTGSLLWLTLWPLVIYLGYKFTTFNMTHFKRMEKLEEEK